MKTEKFISLIDGITPTEERKSQMLDNILKSRRKKNSYSMYYKYATGIASVFVIAVILTAYPSLKNYTTDVPTVQTETVEEKKVISEAIIEKADVVAEEKVIQTPKATVTEPVVSTVETTVPSAEPVIEPAIEPQNEGIMLTAEEDFSGRAYQQEIEEILYENISEYLCYIPKNLANQDSFLGGRKMDNTVNLTFSNEDATLDVKITPEEMYSGEYTSIEDAKNLASFTLKGDGVAVTYNVYGEIEIETIEYFNKGM